MPPSRKTRNKSLAQLNKQKNNIKMKLINISLKVDYYIYKNRPISVPEATTYYHEVMSYQALCKHDARSLQVIEKLSRFMLAIIREQTRQGNGETNTSGACTQALDNDRVSSVHLMTEEDENDLQMGSSQYNGTVSFSNPQNRIDGSEQNILTDILKLNEEQKACAFDNDINNKQTELHGKENEDKTEELLSFNDLTINKSQKTCFKERETCSPSILDNTIHQETQNMRNEGQYGQDMNEVDRVLNDLFNSDKSKATRANNGGKKTYLKANLKHTPKLQIETRSLMETKNVQNELLTSATKPLNKQEKINSIKAAKQKKLTKNTVKMKTKQGNNAKINSKNKNTTNTTIRPNKIRNKADIVYENDLSWIENIKFVRQVTSDEYEPTLGESLWENCDVPINWADFV